MVTPKARDRSHESILNDVFARYLREQCGLDAVAETLKDGKRPDIIVRLQQGLVILETEVAPALTVEADALSRIGMTIDGLKVQNVYAIKLPANLRSASQQYLYERMTTASLVWQEWRIDGTSGAKSTGLATDLGNTVKFTTPPAGNLDEAVDVLDDGARRAGARLYSSPGTLERVSRVFGIQPSEEVTNMAALVIINAMVFQERLAQTRPDINPVTAASENGVYSPIRLLQAWDYILNIDYYPIFKMARDVVGELSGMESAQILQECALTAEKLLGMGAVGRHDVAGRIFNRLIADRKLLAAYYTSIPTSILLAGLALSPDAWSNVDWSIANEISKLRVIDPACGTGTLLMAAYRQIVQNHVAANPENPEHSLLHKSLVENVVGGADVVQAAIHLTAATLAAMSPSVRFDQMQLHTLRLGLDSSKKVWLGSLDWLKSGETQSFFSTTEEQLGGMGAGGGLVKRPQADLVISNPPYIRRGSDGGKEKAISRVFSIPEGDSESKKAITKWTSGLLKKTPANQIAGHGSSFTVLADRIVKPGGRIAFVLPVTALFGDSLRDIRRMLASKYEIDYVVSTHDPKLRSMSYDTKIAEALLVARRLTKDERPSGRGRFVNLWHSPRQETDALALVRAISAAASTPVLRSDGPPVGGSPLILGGEQWGEIVDGPVGERSWTSARWRNALTGQFATALTRGELWRQDGTGLAGNVPVAALSSICNVGPQHRQIRGSIGRFDAYHGWDEQDQFPAIWSHKESTHGGMLARPNARLVPIPQKDYESLWAQRGTLQITADVQYDSQRIITTRTTAQALGIRAWHTLNVNEPDILAKSQREIALNMWCNSTLGTLLHVDHSNRSQKGRGTGNKGMLESLMTLDVRELQPWQLAEAQAIWPEFRDLKFQSFHQCAMDPVRIALDERIVRDLLGLGEDAVASVARLRSLLASEPSIHGSKEPVVLR